jgi:hypothetical protein
MCIERENVSYQDKNERDRNQRLKIWKIRSIRRWGKNPTKNRRI